MGKDYSANDRVYGGIERIKMNQEKLEMFYKEEVAFRFNSFYNGIFELLECKSDFYKKKWLEQLNLLFEEICKKQKQGEIGKLGYIHFTFLRMHILTKEDTLAVYGYGKKGYFGQEYTLGTIDVSCFMEKFRQVWQELEKVSLKYVGKISRLDIKRLMLEESCGFLSIWFSLLRQYRREWLLLPSFQEIEKEEYFRVQIGEYYEPPVVLYVENQKKKEQEVKKKIRREKAYNGWDFRGCRLDGMEFSNKECSDSFWENTSVREGTWNRMDLRGSVFENVQMAGSVMKESFLQETEWHHVNLENSVFETAFFENGRRFIKNYRIRGYLPVKFVECNLKYVTFYKSFLDGVDFTEADISGCKFIHTSMKQCRIRRNQLAGIELDEQAENEIYIIE